MTQEEKAKAYDEALERAKMYQGMIVLPAESMIETIFPELRESEDESTRKRIIALVNAHGQGRFKESMLAWLEKQCNDKEYTFKAIPRLLEMIEPTNRAKAYCQKLIDSLEQEGYVMDAKIVGECLKQMNGEDVPMATMDEQKPYGQRKECLDCQFNYAGECKGSCQIKRSEQNSVDKVELKFKVGDWIVNNISKDVFLIKSTNNGYYTLEDIKGNIISPCLPPCEDASHPWTIEDAKDGDVLFAENFDNIGGCVFLFKGLDSWKFDAEGDRAIATGYCCTSITESGNTDFGIQGPDCVEIKRVHPATKEQRDLLFQKMHEAGYEWDNKKKELKLLITNGGDFFESENCEQNPAWSEEDEEIVTGIINDIQERLEDYPTEQLAEIYFKEIKWLKSLKDRNSLW